MVITFYKAQERQLRRYFADRGVVHEVLPGGSRGPRGSLRICSVDQAQGSEADVVVLSCVRANAEKSVGFLKNPNRLNVAISRAKERLVIVGSKKTLDVGGGKHWKSMIAHARVVDDVNGIP